MLRCSWQLEGVGAQGEVSLPWLLTPGRALDVSDGELCECVPALDALAPRCSDDCCGVLSSEQFAQYPGSEKEGGRRGTKL